MSDSTRQTTTVPSFAVALADYTSAVASRAYWEDHGTRRDGRREQAQETELTAKRVLVTAHRLEVRAAARAAAA